MYFYIKIKIVKSRNLIDKYPINEFLFRDSFSLRFLRVTIKLFIKVVGFEIW